MSWWFLGAILIYTFFLAPVSSSTEISAWGRFFYYLFFGAPALLFFYYCVYRGFVDVGVLS